MASFNQVVLLGNVTRDVELRNLSGGGTVAEFGLAMNRKYKTANGEEREEVCFVDCTAFGKPAEVLAQYVKKGRPLLVQGRLKFDAWDDKNTGAKRSRLTVVVENFQFVGGRQDNEDDAQAPLSRLAQRGPSSNAYKNAKADKVAEDPEIPF